ncbi:MULTISPECIES: TIR domain-containing protein [Elizabethkingia]|uniref:TIR domain-containing protein n=1 Tax=Elizabethkingia TaxID=308865 RepID=UPI0009C88B1C|nr:MULTISPECIES: nucleotide-binding protein [Elizabethkingia]MCP1251222.1 nucleotide-binding protein [Elizabethkingia sp. S0634]OPC34433.1 hypothetical protein BAX99_06035 [Elizabethkingia miricola]
MYRERLNTKINSKYEILYSDLESHNVGEYLVSRNFKIFMSALGAYDNWKEIFDRVQNQRSYVSLGTDHGPWDASNTLVVYFNALLNQSELEDLIVKIIVNFIKNKDIKDDFSDVLESVKVVGFEDENIKLVNEAINLHLSKEFEEKQIKEKKDKKSNLNQSNKKVFIVHGHNEEIKLNVARLIDKVGLEAIILNEQSDEGLTIIEKFEKHAEVSFAIILLTYDDFGNKKSENEKNKRARQNVILELGYFIAKLGRNKVIPLYEKGVELPSDISGVLYTEIDNSGSWRFKVVKELKSAGFNIDANHIL